MDLKSGPNQSNWRAVADYLKRRKGRDGFFFQRSVPSDCRAVIGKATWTRKAGNSAAEAKRNVPQFLAETEQLIKEARGQQLTPSQKLRSLLPERGLVPADIDAHDLVSSVSREPMYLDNQGSVNPRYEELHDLAKGVLDGTATDLKTPEQLLTQASLLKSPAASTQAIWRRHLDTLMDQSGREYIQQVTREDALAYRASELTRCQASTVRTRLRYLNGLFGVAAEEGWVQSNPFFELTKRVKGRIKKKEVVSLDQADRDWTKLPQHHQLLWHILRWSGAHASEVAGLRWEDIDLSSGVIHFKSHETRPLKNNFRIRSIPIHKNLMPILKAQKFGEGLMFPWSYNAKEARWAAGFHWQEVLGVSPKATRDWAATCLREKDINESVIGRLFGHTPKTQTGVYGSVKMETLRRALDQLT